MPDQYDFMAPVINNARKNAVVNPEDFKDSDGLLVCGKCGKRKQKLIRVTVILGGAAGSESPNGQVRLLHLPPIWSRSAVGSAPDLGSGGHQFESGRFHQLPGRSRLMCARPSSHTENENAR